MLTIDPTHTFMDVLEFKFIVIFATVVAAVWLGNWLYDKTKKHKDKDHHD